MSTPEPFLPAIEASEAVIPANVKSVMATARKNHWSCWAFYAVGPEPELVHSVVLKLFHPGDGIRLVSRHEGADPRKLGFVAGWKIPGPDGIPLRIGWRSVVAIVRETE